MQMRIRIPLFDLMRIRDRTFNLMWIRLPPFTLKRIRIRPKISLSSGSGSAFPTWSGCESATSVAHTKQKFRILFPIRIRPAVSFESGSGFESGSKSGFKSGIESRIWIRIRIPGSGSGSETGLNFLFLYKNFYAASSSNIKSLPSLSSVTWLRTNCARNFQSTRISHIYAFCMCSVPPHANESLAAP